MRGFRWLALAIALAACSSSAPGTTPTTTTESPTTPSAPSTTKPSAFHVSPAPAVPVPFDSMRSVHTGRRALWVTTRADAVWRLNLDSSSPRWIEVLSTDGELRSDLAIDPGGVAYLMRGGGTTTEVIRVTDTPLVVMSVTATATRYTGVISNANLTFIAADEIIDVDLSARTATTSSIKFGPNVAARSADGRLFGASPGTVDWRRSLQAGAAQWDARSDGLQGALGAASSGVAIAIATRRANRDAIAVLRNPDSPVELELLRPDRDICLVFRVAWLTPTEPIALMCDNNFVVPGLGVVGRLDPPYSGHGYQLTGAGTGVVFAIFDDGRVVSIERP